MLGFVSGLVAAIGAETALAVLQSKVFDFPWEPDWRLWIVLPVRRCATAVALRRLAGVRDCLRVRRCSGSLRVMTGVRLPDALRLSGLRRSCNILSFRNFVGRIRRSRRIRQLCADARCDAGASYHVPTKQHSPVGWIRRSRRIRHEQRAQNPHHCALTHSATSAHSPRKDNFFRFFSS